MKPTSKPAWLGQRERDKTGVPMWWSGGDPFIPPYLADEVAAIDMAYEHGLHDLLVAASPVAKRRLEAMGVPVRVPPPTEDELHRHFDYFRPSIINFTIGIFKDLQDDLTALFPDTILRKIVNPRIELRQMKSRDEAGAVRPPAFGFAAPDYADSDGGGYRQGLFVEDVWERATYIWLERQRKGLLRDGTRRNVQGELLILPMLMDILANGPVPVFKARGNIIMSAALARAEWAPPATEAESRRRLENPARYQLALQLRPKPAIRSLGLVAAPGRGKSGAIMDVLFLGLWMGGVERQDRNGVRIYEVRYREIGEMAYPQGRRVYWPAVRQGLHDLALHQKDIDGQRRRFVAFDHIPGANASPDTVITVTCWYPAESERGGIADMALLYDLRWEDVAFVRTMARLYYYWDECETLAWHDGFRDKGTRNRIFATTEDGKRHPCADDIVALDNEELVQLVFDGRAGLSRSRRSHRIREARRKIARLAGLRIPGYSNGVIVVEGDVEDRNAPLLILRGRPDPAGMLEAAAATPGALEPRAALLTEPGEPRADGFVGPKRWRLLPRL